MFLNNGNSDYVCTACDSLCTACAAGSSATACTACVQTTQTTTVAGASVTSELSIAHATNALACLPGCATAA